MQRDSASTGAPLIGTEWQLVQLGVAPAQREAQARGRPAQLVLRAGGGYEGSSGCNRIFGTYRRQGDSLSLAPVAGTKMACPGPLMKQERNLIAALDATTSYRITGHALHLFHGGKLLARFESPSPIPGK